MRLVRFGMIAIAVAMFIAGCGSGMSSGEVLVEVNGDKITEGDLKFLGEINPRIEKQLDNPQGKKRILDNLVEQNLLYQQAIKQGLNRDSKVKAKADLYRRVIIAQALIEEEMENAAKKYYDDNPDEFKKLKLSDIVIKFGEESKKGGKGKARSEGEALKITEQIKAKLDKGESFDAAAKESSEDALTKMRGGNLGLISKNDKRLLARGYQPVLEKAFEMKVGEVSAPIKTGNGYHIITVTRGIELEPYDEAKNSILFKVRGDVRKDLIVKLKEDAKIVYPGEEGKPGEEVKEKAVIKLKEKPGTGGAKLKAKGEVKEDIPAGKEKVKVKLKAKKEPEQPKKK